MTCAGCEARREWMRRQCERSKERMRLCIERLGGGFNPKQSAISKDDGITEQSNGADCGPEQQSDGSA